MRTLLIAGAVVALAGCEPTAMERADQNIARTQKLIAEIDAKLAAAGPTKEWSIAEDRSLITDDPGVTLSTRSQLLDGPYGFQRADLYVRCRERGLDVIVAWPRSLDGRDETTATIRLDAAEPFEIDLAHAGSGDAFGWWGAKEAGAILSRLKLASRMIIRAAAYDGAPMDAEFSVEGLADHIPAIDTACPPPT